MTRPAKLTKIEMATRLEGVFKEYGYEGASLKMLADATGLSKASLYHHYPKGKSDMAANVLAQSGARLQKLVLAPLGNNSKSTGAEKILASLDGAAAYYAGDVPICLMNSLLLGDGRTLFSAAIEAAVSAWRKGIAAGLRDDGADGRDADIWAEEAIGRIQGALVLCRVEGRRNALDTCLAALRADIEDWTGAS